MKFGFWSGVSFHPDLSLMVWQPRGILDQPHVEQLIRLLEQAEDEAERPFNRYIDLSRLDAVELTFDYLSRLASSPSGLRRASNRQIGLLRRGSCNGAACHCPRPRDHRFAAAGESVPPQTRRRQMARRLRCRSEAGPLTNGIWRLATSKAVIETQGDFIEW